MWLPGPNEDKRERVLILLQLTERTLNILVADILGDRSKLWGSLLYSHVLSNLEPEKLRWY